MSLTCEQLEAHLAAFVFDELDDAAVAEQVRAHLQTCPACREQVRRFRATVDMLHEAAAALPAPTLSADRRQALRDAAPRDASTPSDNPPPAAYRFARWTRPLALAASVALLGAAAVGIYQLMLSPRESPRSPVAMTEHWRPEAKSSDGMMTSDDLAESEQAHMPPRQSAADKNFGSVAETPRPAIVPAAPMPDADRLVKGGDGAGAAVADEKLREMTESIKVDQSLEPSRRFATQQRANQVAPGDEANPARMAEQQQKPQSLDGAIALRKTDQEAADARPLNRQLKQVDELARLDRLQMPQQARQAEPAEQLALPPASAFRPVPVNPFVMTQRDRFSAFAFDVDTASYALCRRYILRGFRPPAGAVRIQQFINRFDYDYPARAGRAFAVHVDGTRAPFGENLWLVKIGVKAMTPARDAGIQVEFDPARVRRYRLIGDEHRDIAEADLRDNDGEAGAVAAGQSVTALYEVELIGDEAADLGTIRVRYRDVDTRAVEEISDRIQSGDLDPVATPKSHPRLHLAAAAAEFAELLRGSEHARSASLEAVERVLIDVTAALPRDQQAAELLNLVRKARGLPPAP